MRFTHNKLARVTPHAPHTHASSVRDTVYNGTVLNGRVECKCCVLEVMRTRTETRRSIGVKLALTLQWDVNGSSEVKGTNTADNAQQGN